MIDKTEPKSTKTTDEGASKAARAEAHPPTAQQPPTEEQSPTSQRTAADNPAQPEGRSVEQIERDIEATRADLGDTVEALAEKTDVKAQAKAKATEAKANAQAKAQEAAETVKTDRTVQYALAGATAAIVLIVLLKRRS